MAGDEALMVVVQGKHMRCNDGSSLGHGGHEKATEFHHGSLPWVKSAQLQVSTFKSWIISSRASNGAFPFGTVNDIKVIKVFEFSNLNKVGNRDFRKGKWISNVKEISFAREYGRIIKQWLWNEQILLNYVNVLKIYHCPSLKRFPTAMEKLPNLSTLFGEINSRGTKICKRITLNSASKNYSEN